MFPTFDIAQYGRNLRRIFPGCARFGHGDHVRAFAGAENAKSKRIVHGALNNRANIQNK